MKEMRRVFARFAGTYLYPLPKIDPKRWGAIPILNRGDILKQQESNVVSVRELEGTVVSG